MNKYKKIATAVVATVMAGTMVASLAACAPKAPKTLDTTQTKLETKLDANGALQYDADTQLNLSVGHENNRRAITFQSSLVSGTTKLPDGTDAAAYTTGTIVDENSSSLKPAWRGLAKALDVKFNDLFKNRKGGAQITDALKNQEVTETTSQYDIITGAANEIVTNGNAKTSLWLDLNQYLDLMPNYKDFLLKNPLVYMSLTSDTASGAMYYAPYFDGYDDIEKYTLAKKDWTVTLLDGTVSGGATTFAGQVAAKNGTERTNGSTLVGNASSVKSFMGTDGYEIAVTDPAALQSGSTSKVQDGKDKATVTIKVDHQAALRAAKDETTTLGAAMKAALGSAYTGNSGNIVDLQNAVIDGTQGGVTGAQLLNILRAYIDVAYTKDGAKFYTKRSDVFNSAYAAWDVDLFVAFSRCVVTCQDMLKTPTTTAYIYALAGRQNTRSDRTNDVISLIGELYGIRGLESRTNYAYIDKDGTLQDARQDAEMYNAVAKANDMVKEGLLLTENLTNGSTSLYDSDTANKGAEVWVIHDYSQTQTKWGFYSEGKTTSASVYVDQTNSGANPSNLANAMNAEWDFAPILTAVSKWDIDGDGNHTDIMRFTESWRSTKDSGFCVPYAAVKDDPNKLSAVLKFIDYFFSNDGQILMTFGPQSTNGNGTDANGFWYGTEVTDAPAAATETFGGQTRVTEAYKDKYFAYNGKVYTGTFYKDHMAPTMTTNSMNFFLGKEVNGHKLGEGTTNGWTSGKDSSNGAILSYTDYARGVVGGALPIGNKDQALEAQCTPDKVVVGQDIVAIALRNETVKHVYVEVDNGQSNNYWYTIVPSAFPYDPADASEISDGAKIPSLSNVLFKNGGDAGNYLISLMYWGYGDKSITVTAVKDSGSSNITTTTPANAEAAITFVNTYGDNNLEAYMQSAWSDLLGYYNEYISLL